jgi:2-polyprenyl-6-methoxyphenol hydroxylase-like FAD-dependent oxidoreductase
MTQQVIVIGAGIGGLAAALALARQGVRVRVIERASEIREAGAGIQTGPNAFRAFARLGVGDQMEAIGFRPGAIRLLDSLTDQELSCQTLGQAFEARFEYPYRVAFRADVQRVLLQAALALPDLIEITLGDGFTSFEQDPDGVAVLLDSGATVQGTALIGADGIHSRVRGQVLSEAPPLASGYIAYRAVLPVAEIPEHLLTDDVQVWVGPYHHLVCYKLRRGQLFNLVAIFRSARTGTGWDATGSQSELMAEFAGVSAKVSELLMQIRDWKVWVLYDRDPEPGWSEGRATLLGDAAHPMLPYLAQGACMAIEDAVVLGDQFSQAPTIPEAFAAYERLRYPRTSAVQLAARRAGVINHVDGAERDVRNEALTRQKSDDYEAVAWLFEGADSPAGQPEGGYGVFSTIPGADTGSASRFSTPRASSNISWPG